MDWLHTALLIWKRTGAVSACHPAFVKPFFITDNEVNVLLYLNDSANNEAPTSPKLFSDKSRCNNEVLDRRDSINGNKVLPNPNLDDPAIENEVRLGWVEMSMHDQTVFTKWSWHYDTFFQNRAKRFCISWTGYISGYIQSMYPPANRFSCNYCDPYASKLYNHTCWKIMH